MESMSETEKERGDRIKRERAKTKRAKQRNSSMLCTYVWKLLFLLAALGVSESCVSHTSWWLRAYCLHSQERPSHEGHRITHCLHDHLLLACICRHSELQNSAFPQIHFLYIKPTVDFSVIEQIRNIFCLQTLVLKTLGPFFSARI